MDLRAFRGSLMIYLKCIFFYFQPVNQHNATENKDKKMREAAFFFPSLDHNDIRIMQLVDHVTCGVFLVCPNSEFVQQTELSGC